jgi:hypothetical protein
MNNKIKNINKAKTIVNQLTNKESAIEFLNNNRIAEVESIIDIQEYKRDYDRNGILMKIIENEKSDPVNVIIDVKSGQPSVDQIYDSLFGFGANSTKRVIAYTGSTNYDDRGYLGADLEVVRNLLLAINSNEIGLYLVKASAITDNELFRYELIDAPEDDQNNFAAPLPSRIEFLEELFWQVYYIPLEKFLRTEWKPFCDGFFHCPQMTVGM